MAKLYIAYGSNLNKGQMGYRCPTAEFVGTGVIEDYELQFRGSLYGSHATIVPKDGSSVPVGLWNIKARDERCLDMYEGYPSYYFKENLEVKMGDKTVQGMAYIMDQRMDFGNPTKGYYDVVRKGYEDCGLDTDVLDKAVDMSMDQARYRMQAEGMRLY